MAKRLSDYSIKLTVFEVISINKGGIIVDDSIPVELVHNHLSLRLIEGQGHFSDILNL